MNKVFILVSIVMCTSTVPVTMSLHSCQMNTFNLSFPAAVESTRMPPEHVNLNLFSDAALIV